MILWIFNNDNSKTKNIALIAHDNKNVNSSTGVRRTKRSSKTFLMRNRHNRPHDYGIYRASGQGL